MKKYRFALLMLFIGARGLAADGGFLFVTFRDETTPLGEQIYFGLSQDARTWEALNNAQPILVSPVGEKGVRDPFLLRSPDGKKFFLLATDLSISRNRSFARAIRAGSKAITIWESDDLVNWSEPRLVQVAAGDAGCAWAPEALYNEETHDYLVYWSSKNQSDNFSKQRIWAAHTTDFKTFGKPFVFMDHPQGVTETSIVREFGTYYRFSTLEKSAVLIMETSRSLQGDWQPITDFPLSNTKAHGAIPFILKQSAGGPPPIWSLFLYTNTYRSYVSDDIGSGNFTPRESTFAFSCRAGSILPVTEEEYARLKKAYP
jgi:hypothetical protein